jgi:LmbE family N-acetylglucosaminyl deacetylase
VLVPHWRWLLPPTVLATWRCVGFHTSPLPRGRGGSPIQNQIVRGMYESELCAFEMNEHMDADDVLIRELVDLSTGSLAEILVGLARQTGAMSRRILQESPKAVPQAGEPSLFERRRPEESEIPRSGLSPRQLYDRIRMVDGLDYPRAFIKYGPWRITFRQARLSDDAVQATATWNKVDEETKMPDRILVLAATRDDESIGCGASIARWTAKGNEVAVWFATDGVSSRHTQPETAEERLAASRSALALLGVEALYAERFPDNSMDTVSRLAICQAMDRAVCDFGATWIVTHSQADLNVDHRIVGECAAVVSRPIPGQSIKSLWHFEVPSSTGWFGNGARAFVPNAYVDVSDYWDLKVEALRAYGPEIPAWPHARSTEALAALARVRGATVGLASAEAFEISLQLR